ncbi:hypothetical protein Nepgr_007872 [Nepenthes gracilis]|uniref:Uncharacterized protein n=1 Tax=Nepenthes gracilis TaxID=150966 RepID=A0AAD3S8J6_NEPGR|nr:hypothetical protein Nepgr_007872 [Nepenthes gracilis]
MLKMLVWDSVLMLLVQMILFGSASLMPTTQSMDCGVVDSCISLGIYCCIDDNCEMVWYTNCTVVVVVVVREQQWAVNNNADHGLFDALLASGYAGPRLLCVKYGKFYAGFGQNVLN